MFHANLLPRCVQFGGFLTHGQLVWVHVERWEIAAAFRMLKSFAVSVPRLREQVGRLRLQRFGVALATIRYA